MFSYAHLFLQSLCITTCHCYTNLELWRTMNLKAVAHIGWSLVADAISIMAIWCWQNFDCSCSTSKQRAILIQQTLYSILCRWYWSSLIKLCWRFLPSTPCWFFPLSRQPRNFFYNESHLQMKLLIPDQMTLTFSDRAKSVFDPLLIFSHCDVNNCKGPPSTS